MGGFRRTVSVTMSYVTDTHALIWHLHRWENLSPTVQAIFAQADAGQITIVIPIIVLVELIYLGEKGRVPADLVDLVLQLLREGSDNYQLAPLDLRIVESITRVPRDVVPDMPDRVITATALALDLPLISKDSAIAKVDKLQVIW